MIRLSTALVLLAVLATCTAAQVPELQPGQIGFSLSEPGVDPVYPVSGEPFDVHVVLRPTPMGLSEIEFQISTYVPMLVIETDRVLDDRFEDLDPAADVFRLRPREGCWTGRDPLVLLTISYFPLDDRAIGDSSWYIAGHSFLGGTGVSPAYRTCDGVLLPLVRDPWVCEYSPHGSLELQGCLLGAYESVFAIDGGMASGQPGEIVSYPLRFVQGWLLAKRYCDLYYDTMRSIDFSMRWDPSFATWEGVLPGPSTILWNTDVQLEPGRATIHMDAGSEGDPLPQGEVLLVPQLRLKAERGWSPIVTRVSSGTTDAGDGCGGDVSLGQLYSGVDKIDPWSTGEVGVPEALRAHHLLVSEGPVSFSDHMWADLDLSLGLTEWDVQSFLRAAMGRPLRTRMPSFGTHPFQKSAWEVQIPVTASDGLQMMLVLPPQTPRLLEVRASGGIVDWWRDPPERLQVALSDVETGPHVITLSFDGPPPGGQPRLRALRGFDADGQPVPVTTSYFVTATPEMTAAARLLAPAPNPFNPRTRIRFVLDTPASIEVGIHDARGRRLRRFAYAKLGAGRHEVTWDGRDAAGHRVGSGVYLVHLSRNGDVVDRQKVVLVQ